jgi:hypothetical protein
MFTYKLNKCDILSVSITWPICLISGYIVGVYCINGCRWQITSNILLSRVLMSFIHYSTTNLRQHQLSNSPHLIDFKITFILHRIVNTLYVVYVTGGYYICKIRFVAYVMFLGILRKIV